MVSLNNVDCLLEEGKTKFKSAFGNIGVAKVENGIVQFYDVINHVHYKQESCKFIEGDTFSSAAKRAGYCLS